MSEMSEGAKDAWERWREENLPDIIGGGEVYWSAQAFAAGFEAALAAMEQEAAKLDKAASDESLSRESRILFITQASALRMAIWSIKNGQEANKR